MSSLEESSTILAEGESKVEEVLEKPKSTGKKLSFPFVEDRRRSASCIGHFGRVVICAVDTSCHSRDAFECE